MPELNYAVTCDYVRAERGIAHVIAAGIDTVYAPEVPTGHNVGLLVGLLFSRNECGRPHRVEVFFQDVDGERLVELNGVITPEWGRNLPTGWRTAAVIAFNIGLPLPKYGQYAFEILVNDNLLKSIPFRVVRPPTEGQEAQS